MFGVLCGTMGRFDEAVAAAQRAVQLDPRSPASHAWLQWISLAGGRYEQAEEIGRAALELLPDVPLIHLWTGTAIAMGGDHRRAEPHFAQAAKFDQIPMVPLWMAIMRALQNDKAGARAQLAKAHRLAERRYICPYEAGSVHAALGEMDEAYRWMERGLGDRCSCFIWLMTEPWLKELRADPRFPALAAKVGLWSKVRSF